MLCGAGVPVATGGCEPAADRDTGWAAVLQLGHPEFFSLRCWLKPVLRFVVRQYGVGSRLRRLLVALRPKRFQLLIALAGKLIRYQPSIVPLICSWTFLPRSSFLTAIRNKALPPLPFAHVSPSSFFSLESSFVA